MEYGWLSVLPPLIAIVLAIMTRKVIPALGVAVVLAIVLIHAYDPSDGSWNAAGLADVPRSTIDHIWHGISEGNGLNPIAAIAALLDGDAARARDSVAALWSSDHLKVYYFTMLFGALVGILHASGAMQSFVLSLSTRIRDRRGGQIFVWLIGLLIFFDDYANTLLVGTTMRTTADRLKFSREKLAYLVDSTAAPVAGLSLISTWVATEISYMAEGLTAAGQGEANSAFELFIQSLPYRFYPIFALSLVGIIAWSRRDFGPMRAAEQAAFVGKSNSPSRDASTSQASLAPAWTAMFAIVITVMTIIGSLLATGSVDTEITGFLRYWGTYIGNANAYDALIWGALSGTMTAFLLSCYVGKQPSRELILGGIDGVKHLLPAMLILLLAWTLSRLTTADFLNTQGTIAAGITASHLPSVMIPTFVFLLASVVAFSTGTSWGTMGLLVPLAIPVAIASSPDEAILLATTGAVLAGAIFGDHCSPISDTTVLSSQASGCDHIGHVTTQMPYALLAAVIAIVFGTLPAAAGVSPWWLLIGGTIAMSAIIYAVGQVPLEASQESV